MAKQALRRLLEQVIGKYVRNLDAESLNVAVWSGKIELHNLELDVAAVNMELDRKAAEAPNLALPFKVLSGKFDALQVEIPWSSLTSQPIVLRAQGLTVDVEPYNRRQSDHVPTQTTVSVAKMREKRSKTIESSDKYRQQTYAVKKLALSDSNGSQSTFSSRLMRRLAENIQIEISDVHISLSDDDGAAGVVMESLSLITTDEEGKRTFVDRTAGQIFLHKMLQIKGFGVYLDENEFHETLASIDENANSQSTSTGSHSYILAPLSFQAQLRQADGNVCIDYSKYQLSSELSTLTIMLSRNQLDIARKISTEVSSQYSAVGPLFPEYRPLERVSKENAHEWWKYAFRCIGRLSGRSSWNEFIRAYRKRKAYIPLYKRHAHHSSCSWIKELSEDELMELIAIEQDRSISIEGLMLWRDVADAQVDREREKEEAQRSKEQSYFSSIFSSSKTAPDEDDPPIHLTEEEIKQLEAMSKKSFADEELSKDSKLYDIKFVLNALEISLTSYNMRQLAALDMGRISLGFKAAANGAYDFKFDLFDLEIQDRATISSLFPSVLRSIKNESTRGDNGAFMLNLSKAKTGDQHLQLKLAAFEAVASQVFFKELHKFVSDSPTRGFKKGNPILAQSLSGSVDLFYDADPGTTQDSQAVVVSDGFATTTQIRASEFSNAFFDAWKEKAETEISWVLDVDIKAPIVIIPESCNEASANILIFDLGHFQMKSGNVLPTKKIIQWFQENPTDNQSEPSFDSGSLTMNDLTFKVGTAREWLQMTRPAIDHSAVIEPISVKLSFGIETSSPEDPPRVCCMGVIPSISFRLSPSQGSRFFHVIRAWAVFLDDIADDEESHDVHVVDNLFSPRNEINQDSDFRNSNQQKDNVPQTSMTEVDKTDDKYPARFFFLIGLQHLSVTVTKNANNWLEAHLVSVYASSLMRSNGSSESNLQMGWFWILDMIQSDFPRRERLLAHSNLPQMPVTLSESKKYDILEQLTEQGVFKQDYAGSTELADITYQQNVSKIGTGGASDPQSILDANFSSLFIHWNPHAMKGVSMMIESFTCVMDAHGDSDTFILSAERALTPRNTHAPNGKAGENGSSALQGTLLIKAKMESLDIYLQSARDDYPLFVLTVSRGQIDLLMYPEPKQHLECSLSLGDVRVATPDNMGRTLPVYRTLLGLAPSQSESLLTVNYYQGRGAIDSLEIASIKDKNVEVYADVILSPMRASLIQSQVLALVEYITEGILGVLFYQAATSAAEAALEIAASVSGEKIFMIQASSFDLILPQAAYIEDIFSVHAGILNIEYHMYPGTGGSEAKIALSDVSLKDNTGALMQEEPIRLIVGVVIPSDEIGGIDEQAMRVDIEISEASFCLSRAQYAQIIRMLDYNFAEVELFLRQEESTRTGISEAPTDEPSGMPDFTHAGNKVVDFLRRKYINIKIRTLGLQLFGSDLKDPLVGLAAVNANIGLQMNYDKDEMACQVSLQDLVCEDRRFIASQRQYRQLFDQGSQSGSDGSNSLFFVEYISGLNHCSTELQIGSPQLVLIPDAISELVSFFKVERRDFTVPVVSNPSTELGTLPSQQQVVHVDSTKGDDGLEASLVLSSAPASSKFYTTTYSVKTKVCSIVLVDLGSQLKCDPIAGKYEKTSENSQLTETLVLQGIFDAIISMDSDPVSYEICNAEFQAQSDAMEIFSAFGRDMLSPLQILEPSQAAAHGSLKTETEGGTTIEIRAAATTPLEWSFSMHNAALISAISNSLSELFTSSNDSTSDQSGDMLDGMTEHELTNLEALRIQQLASALGNAQNESFQQDAESMMMSTIDDSGPFSLRSVDTSSLAKKIQVKITMTEMKVTVINDLQGLDEALFRFSVITFVAGGELDLPSDSSKTTIDFYLNTSIAADYFDSSVNLWSKLLIQPWEITLKLIRAPSNRFKTHRLSSTFDLESFPCHISLSQEFLASLASANRMWSIYSMATNVSSHSDKPESTDGDDDKKSSLKHSMAATAARSLVTSLPYAIENHCGSSVAFSLPGKSIDQYPCPSGSIKYFRFQPPQGSGYGGKRLYGQDVEFEKSITLFLESSVVVIPHLDAMLSCPHQAHNLPDGRVLLTYVVREGKTTVLHLASNISFQNHTSIPFAVSIEHNGINNDIGTCAAHNQVRTNTVLSTNDGVAAKTSNSFSIPIDLLKSFSEEWSKSGKSSVLLSLSPHLASSQSYPGLLGALEIEASLTEISKSDNKCYASRFDVICRPEGQSGDRVDPFVVQVLVQLTLVENANLYVEVILEPRALIENIFPIAIKIRTPMPHTFSSSNKESVLGNDVIYDLKPGNNIEIFTPGPSIAISAKPVDNPIAGSPLDWMDSGGWIDLPLVSEFKLPEPLLCRFPFVDDDSGLAFVEGNEFIIAEGHESLSQLSTTTKNEEKDNNGAVLPPKKLSQRSVAHPLRTFLVTVCNYGIDHTGDILFERSRPIPKIGNRRNSQYRQQHNHSPYGAFASEAEEHRLTLLPSGDVPLHILQMTMDEMAGFRKSLPFCIDDIVIGEGGVGTTPIFWENKKRSGYFAYRKIINDHQSEIHVVPEFVVFNGSKDVVVVREGLGLAGQEIVIEPGATSQLKCSSRLGGLELAFSFVEKACRTRFVRVDQLGLKMEFVIAQSGARVGSVCFQTAIDTLGNARLVVKIGEVKIGSSKNASRNAGMLADDYIRFRVRWSEMQLILNESQQKASLNHLSMQKVVSSLRNRSHGEAAPSTESFEIVQQPITSINLSRFTIDFQRVFKESSATTTQHSHKASPERSQISVIIHNLQVKDLTPDSKYPVVFDCTSNTSFLDLCIRTRGPLDADIVKVDLFDLNLAHLKGKSESIILTTSENYVWKCIDVINQIYAASGEVGGYALILKEDEEHGGFIVKVEESHKEEETKYTPPEVDRFYDIDLARVSPFSLLITFQRTPNVSRYQLAQGGKGAALVNYFTHKLKFSIDKAGLRFARYQNRHLRGPSDRLVESLMAVYVSRMKFKIVTILSASSLQDWRSLANRDGDEDEYVEGDILRATGNLAGRSANFVFKKVTAGLGDGLSNLTNNIGDGIEDATDKIGAGKIGSGVNNVISGVGSGVGKTVKGVGGGAGKVLKGAGQGIGHMVGGITGGVLQVGKGIGKGITKGDSKAMVHGIGKGVNQIGGGIAQGTETVVMGAADGVLHAGKGIFSGVKKVGTGLGNAFTGKKKDPKRDSSR